MRFLVCEDLQDADKDIAEYGDGSVILCTDGYTIYDDIKDKEGVDGHLAVTHSDTYVIGDAHTNTCENRHSFLRQWLAKFKGGLEASPPEIPRLPRTETQLTERLVRETAVLQCIGMSGLLCVLCGTVFLVLSRRWDLFF